MTTTGHWYINPDGTKADFTDPSVDVNVAGGTVTRDIRKVETVSGDRPRVTLWKGAGAAITSGEVTAAIADQDSASVPTIAFVGDVPSGQQGSIADLSAPAAQTSSTVATANGSDAGTTQTLANALKVATNLLVTDVANNRTAIAALVTAVNAIITRLEVAGIDVTV